MLNRLGHVILPSRGHVCPTKKENTMKTVEIVSLKAAYDYLTNGKVGQYVNLKEIQELTLRGKAGSDLALSQWRYGHAV